MKLNNDPKLYPFILAPGLVTLLDDLIKDQPNEALCINFRDPDYSYERGGWHPVELHLSASGMLETVTDFAYFGQPPFVELGIELDWQFIEPQYFRQFDDMHEIVVGQALFHLWAENFVAYHQMGVYQVEVAPW